MPRYSDKYKLTKKQLIFQISGIQSALQYKENKIINQEAEIRLLKSRMNLLEKKLEFLLIGKGTRTFSSVTRHINVKRKKNAENQTKRRTEDK